MPSWLPLSSRVKALWLDSGCFVPFFSYAVDMFPVFSFLVASWQLSDFDEFFVLFSWESELITRFCMLCLEIQCFWPFGRVSNAFQGWFPWVFAFFPKHCWDAFVRWQQLGFFSSWGTETGRSGTWSCRLWIFIDSLAFKTCWSFLFVAWIYPYGWGKWNFA